MNKKELVEKIESLPSHTSITSFRPYVDKRIVLGLISQLDEPEKVTIPQFVADYIEFQKKNNFHVYGAMRVIEDHYDKRVPEWFYEKNIETFAHAWLDGYEVEEEKRYMIKLKGVPDGAKFLKYTKVAREWYFGMRIHCNDIEVSHTRKELEEAGFDWVFDCEGIEIEEVEE